MREADSAWDGPTPDRLLLESWRHDVLDAVAAVVPSGARVALVNFPNHNNAGDPAMWLGELAILRELDARIVYQASWSSCDPAQVRRRLGDGVLLLHGGGNIGDLYPGGQAATRELLLRELADVPTVQLPQSIHFDSTTNRDHFARLCAEHHDLTLLLRERQSLEIARRHFDVPSHLSPDLAFALGPLARIAPADTDVLWLSRTDAESASGGDTTGFGIQEVDGMQIVRRDWLHAHPDEPAWSVPDRVRLALNRRLRARFNAGGPVNAGLARLDATTYEPLARRWTERGCGLLARGRVVITDRLHGHLLSLLQGIPSVVLDNSYGKLAAIHDGWTQHCELTHWAADPEEALAIARDVLDQDPDGRPPRAGSNPRA